MDTAHTVGETSFDLALPLRSLEPVSNLDVGATLLSLLGLKRVVVVRLQRHLCVTGQVLSLARLTCSSGTCDREH